MRFIFLLFFLPTPLFSQVIFNYVDNQNGIPLQVANITASNLTRVNGVTAISNPCKTGFSGKTWSKETVFNTNQSAYEFSITIDPKYIATVT